MVSRGKLIVPFSVLNAKDDLKKAAKLEYQEFLRKQVQFKLSVVAG